MQQNVAKTGWELTKVARIGMSRSVYGQKRVDGGVGQSREPKLSDSFVLLPTRFWPRTDRELPFLAIALLFTRTVRVSYSNSEYTALLLLQSKKICPTPLESMLLYSTAVGIYGLSVAGAVPRYYRYSWWCEVLISDTSIASIDEFSSKMVLEESP